MLRVANASDFRKNLRSYIEGVADRNETLIVNSNGKSVVVLSLDEYNAMDETDYLLSTEKNKERLNAAIRSFNNDEGVAHELIEI